MKLHFQTEGYLVYTASDAEEAAGMLSRDPDLILLDINMPEVDGLAGTIISQSRSAWMN